MDLLLIHILGALFWIIIGTSWFRLHPLICLFTASLWVGMAGGTGFIQALEEFIAGFGALIDHRIILVLGQPVGQPDYTQQGLDAGAFSECKG